MIRFALSALLLAGFALTASAASAPPRGSMEELVAVHRLPYFYPTGTVTRQFSSFARDGSNNDGFSGMYSYLRYVTDGTEPASLIADFNRPGCIYRFWGTAIPTGRIKFYFDGSDTPEIDIPFREMFEDKHYPFLSPVAGQGLGGFYSYVPIAWKKSCRIVVTSREMRFYQITFLTFPDAKGVRTFRMRDWERRRERFEEIRGVWRALGQRPEAPGRDERTERAHETLAAGGAATLARLSGPGTIRALRLRMEPRTPEALRAVRLRLFYNDSDAPSIESPLGDFFGNGFEDHAWASLLMGQAEGEYYCYFPMPFETSARLEVLHEKYLSRRDQPAVQVSAEVAWEPMRQWKGDQAYFHAHWRRQNPTQDRVNYLFLRAHGRGHLVGTVQYCDTPLNLSVPLYFEGDEQTYADGMLALHGTGSEDYYNLGWYALPNGFSRPGDFPMHGGLRYSPRSVAAYRFHMNDPVVFEHVLHHTMEHGGTNEIEADYASVAYWYQDLPSNPLYSMAVRDRLIARERPGGSLEVEAALVRRDVMQLISEHDEAEATAFSYGRAARVELAPERPVTLEVEAPHAGRFELFASALRTPDSPARMTARGPHGPLGEAQSLRAEARAYAEKVRLAAGTFFSGKQRVELLPRDGSELILDRLWLEPVDWRGEPAPAGGAAHYEFNSTAELADFAVGSGDWEIADGALTPRSGSGGVIWHRRPVRGDVRVEYRARGPQDLNAILLGDGESVGRRRGYVFTFGGDRNRVSAIASDWRRPLARSEARISDTRAFHDIVAEKKGRLLTLTVDGKELLRHELAAGTEETEGYIGLSTTSGQTLYESLRITPGSR